MQDSDLIVLCRPKTNPNVADHPLTPPKSQTRSATDLPTAQYVRARNIQADYIYDEIIDIADDVVDPRAVAPARLRINTRLRQLARMTPRKYRDPRR
jgi:terminase small subunit-like protein